MMFRNARSKYDEEPFTKEEGLPNPYYQEYLNKEDGDFLDGYDWATDEVMSRFFGNLDIFEEDLDEDIIFNHENVDLNLLTLPVDEVSEEDRAKASKETRLMLWLKDSLLQYMELSRDELVTEMIDAMTEADYNDNFRKVWGKDPGEYGLEWNDEGWVEEGEEKE